MSLAPSLPVDPGDLLDGTAAAVHASGSIIREHWYQPRDIQHKGRIDLVTATDLAVEKDLTARLKQLLPQAELLAEETASQDKQAEWLWVIDPLDGTTNFAHSIPLVAVSVALWHRQAPVLGIVSLPMLEETFQAISGKGAWLNGQPIQVSPQDDLEQSLVATGFPYDITERIDQVMPPLHRVLTHCRGLRRMGAAAVDLAYTACGRFEGFFETGLKPWDTAAGWLLVEEAGGTVSRYDAVTPHSLNAPDILATNGRIHTSLSALLQT